MRFSELPGLGVDVCILKTLLPLELSPVIYSYSRDDKAIEKQHPTPHHQGPQDWPGNIWMSLIGQQVLVNQLWIM